MACRRPQAFNGRFRRLSGPNSSPETADGRGSASRFLPNGYASRRSDLYADLRYASLRKETEAGADAVVRQGASARRDPEIWHRPAHDLLKRRGGDGSTVDCAVGAVDHDRDEQLGVRCRHEADERGGVVDA